MKKLLLLSAVLFTFLPATYAQQSDSSYTFLALGDSYTIGESVPEQQRWPVQLVHQLQKQGYSFEDPELLAATGWTTLDLKDAMKQVDFKPPYDLVSLLIGVNDQYQDMDIDRYPSRFRYLLREAIRLSGDKPDHVFVLSIPDYSVTLFGQKKNPDKIDREIQAYNAINKRISDSLGVHYVGITEISEKAASDTSLLADDGLHPSGKMYDQWVDKVLTVLLSNETNF